MGTPSPCVWAVLSSLLLRDSDGCCGVLCCRRASVLCVLASSPTLPSSPSSSSPSRSVSAANCARAVLRATPARIPCVFPSPLGRFCTARSAADPTRGREVHDEVKAALALRWRDGRQWRCSVRVNRGRVRWRCPTACGTPATDGFGPAVCARVRLLQWRTPLPPPP